MSHLRLSQLDEAPRSSVRGAGPYEIFVEIEFDGELVAEAFAEAGRMLAVFFAYYRGGYVVRNDRTGEIVQVSDRADPNWKAPWDQ